MTTITKPPLYRVTACQLVLLFTVSLALLPLGGQIVCSVLVGGMIHIIPHAWSAKIAFSRLGAKRSRDVVRGFYWAQAVKFVLTGAFVVIATQVASDIDYGVVFATFIAMVPTYLVLVAKVLGEEREKIGHAVGRI